jgi:hypothetical protein
MGPNLYSWWNDVVVWFSYIIHVTFRRDVDIVPDQHTELDVYSAGLGRHVPPLRHIFLIQNQPVFARSLMIKWTTKNTTLSEQFQSQILKS